MKTTKLRSVVVVGVLWLTLGAGCSKDPPEPKSCNDGTCCNANTRRYVYYTHLDSVRVDIIDGKFWYGTVGLAFKEPQPANVQYPVNLVEICSLSADKIKGLPTVTLSDSLAYKYLVWGKLYYDPDFATWSAGAISFLSVDRIKRVIP